MSEVQILDHSKRVLTPVERISEILFGFIMTLSLTGTLSVVAVGREDVVVMMLSILGCNLAWGIIDGVLYALASLSERGRNLRLYKFIRGTQDPDASHAAIAEVLPPVVVSVLTKAEFSDLRRRLIALPEPPHRVGLTRDDFKGAFAVCIIVFSSCLPLVFPFLLINEPLLALRFSNGIALVLLFIGGYALARYAGFAKFWTGIVMAVLGIILVAITIQLGG